MVEYIERDALLEKVKELAGGTPHLMIIAVTEKGKKVQRNGCQYR